MKRKIFLALMRSQSQLVAEFPQFFIIPLSNGSVASFSIMILDNRTVNWQGRLEYAAVMRNCSLLPTVNRFVSCEAATFSFVCATIVVN
jgi:hypothetical protein